MKFAVVSQASDKAVTEAVLIRIARALVHQTAVDFASMHETLPCTVGVFDTLEGVPSDFCVMLIVDLIPEAPGALAYHTITQYGRPLLKLGWETIRENGGTILNGPNSMSSAMSHEVLETIGDPYVCLWSDFDGTREVAYEVADPVEGDAYEIDGVSVSNFVGPRWFDASGKGPYDYMGKLSAPLTMSPGGYMVLRSGGPCGAQSQVYGDAMPESKRQTKALYGRRRRDG